MLCLKRHNAFRLPAVAGSIYYPRHPQEIEEIVSCSRAATLAVLGHGSNTLLRSERYIDTIFVVLGERFTSVAVSGSRIRASAGCSLTSIATLARRHSLSGMEILGNIPGTLGGAIFMNAGAYGVEICDVLEKVEFLEGRSGKIRWLQKRELSAAYRYSCFQDAAGVIMSAELLLHPGSRKAINERMLENQRLRQSKLPCGLPSAGSVFKRPTKGPPVGLMVEQLKLKGFRIGNAAVSLKHGGVIVNLGGARAQDILGVAEYVRQSIFTSFGINLEMEMRVY